MTIGFYRDLAIIVFGIVGTGALIFIAVVLYRFLKSLQPMIASVEHTAQIVEQVSTQIVDPMVQIVAIFHMATKGIGFIGSLFRKQGEKNG